MRILWFLVVMVLAASSASAQQNFSCSYADRGACLGFGEQVCSSSGKCVNESSACFDSYQCNYEGFTCKSNVTECVDSYNDLTGRYDGLVMEYNNLFGDHKDLAERFDSLVLNFNSLVGEHETLRRETWALEDRFQSYKFCVEYSDNLNDAQSCTYD